jgi:hypothetical protein
MPSRMIHRSCDGQRKAERTEVQNVLRQSKSAKRCSGVFDAVPVKLLNTINLKQDAQYPSQ